MAPLAFLIGVALGVAAAYAYFDAWRVWMRDEAKKWEDALAAEHKELRAWKAARIGSETIQEHIARTGDDPTARMHG